MWEADIADDKENRPSREEEKRGEPLVTRPVDPEVEAEAFEDYLFDRMMVYDDDSAFQLVRFRLSLRVVPVHLGGPDPALIRIRTANLWAGLRRVYFGEQEDERAIPVPELSHEQTMDNLRQEIAELEERKEKVEQHIRRSRAADSGRPSSVLPREDEEDDPPPPPPFITHTYVIPYSQGGVLVAFSTVPESPSASETTSNTEGVSDVSGTVQSDPYFKVSICREPIRKLVLLSKRVLRLIMAAKESLVKFGTFVPRNDREAGLSPEASRWKAGRDLEWLRLHKEGTFDGEWTWDKVCKAYPDYKKSDVGFLFYVYDFKYFGRASGPVGF
jgi:hypothetical protein